MKLKEKINNLIDTYLYKPLFIKHKYKIMFYKLDGSTWYLISTRNYLNYLNIALYHLRKGHCYFFTIKKHLSRVFEFTRSKAS